MELGVAGTPSKRTAMRHAVPYLAVPSWRAARTAGRIGRLLYVALLTVLVAAVYHGLRALQAG